MSIRNFFVFFAGLATICSVSRVSSAQSLIDFGLQQANNAVIAAALAASPTPLVNKDLFTVRQVDFFVAKEKCNFQLQVNFSAGAGNTTRYHLRSSEQKVQVLQTAGKKIVLNKALSFPVSSSFVDSARAAKIISSNKIFDISPLPASLDIVSEIDSTALSSLTKPVRAELLRGSAKVTVLFPAKLAVLNQEACSAS